MGFLKNLFTKKKKLEEKPKKKPKLEKSKEKPQKKEAVKPVKKKELKKEPKKGIFRKKPEVEEKPKTIKKARPGAKVTDKPFLILKEPHVTEKAADLAGKNQYVFKVKPKANKIEVKKVIEELYDVDVMKVRIVNVIKKRRRLGKIQGWRAGYKKAIIKIKQGQSIEVLPK